MLGAACDILTVLESPDEVFTVMFPLRDPAPVLAFAVTFTLLLPVPDEDEQVTQLGFVMIKFSLMLYRE